MQSLAIRFPSLVNPVFDALFCCGGLLWLLVALQSLSQQLSADLSLRASAGIAATVVVIIGTHLFADTHVAATLFKTYSTAKLRRKYWFQAFVLPAALALVALRAISDDKLTSILISVYFIFVVHHYTAQAYGIALIYCAKGKCLLGAYEKRLLSLLFHSIAGVSILQQLCVTPVAPRTVLGLPAASLAVLPAWLLDGSILLSCLIALVFCWNQVARVGQRRGALPLPVMLMILTTAAIFLRTLDNLDAFWIYAPIFFHATQYLAVTTKDFVEKRRMASPESVDTTTRDIFEYSCYLFGIAGATYVAIPALLSLSGVPFLRCFLAVFLIMTLHHFVLDAVIWKR